jgi:hypothetical protein
VCAPPNGVGSATPGLGVAMSGKEPSRTSSCLETGGEAAAKGSVASPEPRESSGQVEGLPHNAANR